MAVAAGKLPRERATEADLLALPEQSRGFELVDGVLFGDDGDAPPP